MTANHREQNIPKFVRRRVSYLRLVLAADHCHHSDPARLLVAVLCERGGMQPLLARPPAKLRKRDTAGIEPGAFAGHVPVVPLRNATGPATLKVRRDPAASAGRGIQVEGRPGMAIRRVLQDAT